MNIDEGYGHKNDGLEPKYRVGFLYIFIKEMSRKIKGLAEVQIWISMNVYRGIGKKNDGLELKYRFGFAHIYIREISRKIMGLAEVQIWISLNVYRGIRKKNDGILLMYDRNKQKNHRIETKYRFGFAYILRRDTLPYPCTDCSILQIIS